MQQSKYEALELLPQLRSSANDESLQPKQQLSTMEAPGSDVITRAGLETHKALLDKRMSELMHLVDSEQLTMEMYISRLQERVSAETALYRQLKADKRIVDAKRVGARVKIMAAEIKGAQDAAAIEDG